MCLSVLWPVVPWSQRHIKRFMMTSCPGCKTVICGKLIQSIRNCDGTFMVNTFSALQWECKRVGCAMPYIAVQTCTQKYMCSNQNRSKVKLLSQLSLFTDFLSLFLPTYPILSLYTNMCMHVNQGSCKRAVEIKSLATCQRKLTALFL